MPKPRKQQVSVEATPFYHCVSRCVRRAFLCGTDSVSGQCYEHRRSWLEARILALPQIFAIQVAAYAVMSNHYHVVLFVDINQAQAWSDMDVVQRWHQLFKGNVLSQRFVQEEQLAEAEQQRLKILVDEWRSRLSDISWFMRVLNEAIAREANSEDGCSGRFWEGRFKSQALLDEAALLSCMAYVDLNPVRAGIAETPEKADHTSVKRRIKQAQTTSTPDHITRQCPHLLPFVGNPRQDSPTGIQMPLTSYLSLVDATGRILRSDKQGVISEGLSPVLHRIGLDEKQWLAMSQQFEQCFTTFAGNEAKVRSACEQLGYKRPTGIGRARLLVAS
ncbi:MULTISPECIES: transposase [unclassified Oceanobacter]|uniref:transposase n=2 Tax=Oceanobacter TaxID=196079 RepID=UPI0027376F97|nr:MULTISPECIES: transposase [unclassified Oceanobacter]MDP2607882.1 transposase [Oceanobacter sp. 1_MG-2023]MDP2610934.1 transposase [Oceanobacter sp. 2_MG-2023]